MTSGWPGSERKKDIRSASGAERSAGVAGAVHDHQGNRQRPNGEAIYCTDVGQHQMWAAQHLGLDHPDRWLTSGGLGTMGYGLPAAIGAKMGMPDVGGLDDHRRWRIPDVV